MSLPVWSGGRYKNLGLGFKGCSLVSSWAFQVYGLYSVTRCRVRCLSGSSGIVRALPCTSAAAFLVVIIGAQPQFGQSKKELQWRQVVTSVV